MAAATRLELNHTKPKWQGRLKHFVNGFEFILAPSRVSDMEVLLQTWQIPEGSGYRLTHEEGHYAKVAPTYPTKAFISFRRKRDAMLFKFSWIPCEITGDLMRVILPVIRRVMPNIIAQEIIGVQPMSIPFTGPTSIASLRVKYAEDEDPEGAA